MTDAVTEAPSLFEQALERTVDWYLDHLDWCQQVRQRSGWAGGRQGLPQ